MPFPTTGKEVEALVRELIRAKCAAVAGVGHVFKEPFYVSGKQDYVTKLGIESVDGNFEVHYLFVDFAGWENTDRGCEKNPIYFLLFTLRVGQEFIHKRSDGSSSSSSFAGEAMSLRDAFRTGRDLNEQVDPGETPRLYNELLTLAEEVALHDDPHTGMFGHTAEFLLRVEVTPVG